MKLSCYYCKKYTNRSGYCGWCACWTTKVDNKVNEVSTSVVLKGNMQYRINIFPQAKITEVYYNNKHILQINSLPFTPQNIRAKLPLYITFS